MGESVRAGRTGDQRAGRPFLRPIRKVVPLIANVDLSPLVLLLLLQIVLMALGGFQGAFLPFDDRLIAAVDEWLQQRADGAWVLSLHVQPNARKTEFCGLHGAP